MNLPRLLDELHAERVWLERMISAMEIAGQSPGEPLAERLLKNLGEGGTPGWAVRLGRRKKLELIRLAEQIRQTCPHRLPAAHREPQRVVPIVVARHEKTAA
jgi:hypothetical protein